MVSPIEDLNNKTKLKISQFILKASQNSNFILLLLPDTENSTELLPEINLLNPICFGKQEQYSAIFELLKRILPTLNLHKIISEFTHTYENIYNTTENTYPLLGLKESSLSRIEKTYFILVLEFLKKKGLQFFLSMLLCFSLTYVLFLKPKETKIDKVAASYKDQKKQYIQSDLPLPKEETFLIRPELLKKIDEGFTRSKNIQTLALVGIGGSGKTTLARQYARNQKSSLIWEINAETKVSLLRSFESLAYALSRTDEEKEILKRLQGIKNFEEREEKLLLFVKERLKAQPNWFLLYDNVENFADIRHCFPSDPNIWGKGKVIVTTRDNNIGDNMHINCTIQLEELSSQEKLDLFSSILQSNNSQPLTDEQKKQTKQFLTNIPPFPLDVSLAAYYIKATNLSYEKYLDYLKTHNLKEEKTDFESLQKNILKEVSYYTKTRYHIITSTLQTLIDANKNFCGLLLFVSLLDSQDIPKNLLSMYKSDVLVDSFIYYLKKYSLITSRSPTEKETNLHTFSLHRSIQTLGYSFLLRLLNEEEKSRLIEQIVLSIESFYNTYIQKDYSLIFFLIPHLEKFLENLEMLGLPNSLRDQCKQRLSFVLAYAYKRCSRNLVFEKKYFFRAYEIQSKTNHLAPIKLAILLKDLGSTYTDLALPDEAIKYTQKSMELCQQIPDSDILLTDNLQIMGYAYTVKNDFKNAEFFYKEALKAISKAPFTNFRKESESDVYAMLGWLYSRAYIKGEKILESIKYVKRALELVGGSQLFYKDGPKKQQIISRYVARHRTTLGDIYCRAGKYQQAFDEGFKEAQFIIDNSLDGSPCYLLKVYIAIGMGEIYLRQGKLELAKNKLIESLNEAKKLMGESTSLALAPLVFCAEAKIRLGKLDDAYSDCLAALKREGKSDTNYSNLLSLTAHYHAAVIKYKQRDFKKSMSHFEDFFKESKAFCKSFLEENVYNKLEEKKLLDTVKYQEHSLSQDIKQCLQQSIEIFLALYDPSHPFIQDYVLKNGTTISSPDKTADLPT